jgi:pimeloyl-ACP methyl ester carboxylesterase
MNVEGSDTAGGPIEYVETDDGARIACKRKVRPGATPVIFVHGLAVNADLWDVPRIEGPDYTFQSLPSVLHEAGYDIWLVNLRGHGAPTMLSAPPPGQDDWYVDHFILYDLPAVVAHVGRATGRRPFIIGNSMGAMTTAGYLQGAQLVTEDGAAQIVADPKVARTRQADVAGAAFVEFPAALRWPKSLYDDKGNLKWGELLNSWRETGSDLNYPFELLARAGWLQAILQAAGEVRLEWMRPKPGAEPWWKSLPAPIADAFGWMDSAMAQGVRKFAERYKGVQNFRPETFSQGLLPAVDHMKIGVLKQMAKSVRDGTFVSELGTPDHVYADHYHHIELPALVIVGSEDRIANAEVTREVFFEQIRSADKAFHEFEGLAHGDFEYAPEACERVYPLIRSWIAKRDTGGTSA